MTVIRCISSNIKFSDINDGVHQWPTRLPLLSQTICNYLPHILATQEGKKDQIYQLAENLKNLTLIDSHRNWLNERMYPCLFIDTKFYSIIQSGDIWLSETPQDPGSKLHNSLFPRLTTYAVIECLTSNKKIFVCNTHLDHENEITRKQQTIIMNNEIEKILNTNLVLILGDFNTGPQSEIRAQIFKSFPSLYDPWTQLNKNEETTYHKFRGQLSEGKRIDWILVSNNFSCKEMIIDKFHQNHIYPSDHFPIKCSLTY